MLLVELPLNQETQGKSENFFSNQGKSGNFMFNQRKSGENKDILKNQGIFSLYYVTHLVECHYYSSFSNAVPHNETKSSTAKNRFETLPDPRFVERNNKNIRDNQGGSEDHFMLNFRENQGIFP